MALNGQLVSNRSTWYTRTPGNLQQALPFYVTEAGHFFADPEYIVVRDYHDSFLLLYSLQGTGRIRNGSNGFLLPPGSFTILDCHKPHSYASVDGPWEFIWLHFHGETLFSLYPLIFHHGAAPVNTRVILPAANEERDRQTPESSLGSSSGSSLGSSLGSSPGFSPGSSPEFPVFEDPSLSLVSRIMDIVVREDLQSLIQVSSLLHEVLENAVSANLLSDSSTSSAPSQASASSVSAPSDYSEIPPAPGSIHALILDIAAFLKSHFADEVSLEQVSSQFNLSKYYLIRCFKKIYGTTPYQYLLTCRITAAKRMLIETDRSIEEIALETGFKDVSNFIAKFRASTGTTPGVYRNFL